MGFNDMTLEEIRFHHKENWSYIARELRRRAFLSIDESIQYRTHLVNDAMSKLGFNPAMVMNMATSRETAESVIDNLLKKNNIVIEDWSDTDVDESKRGLYIYKDNEIAFFISDICRDGENFIVSTNLKM